LSKGWLIESAMSKFRIKMPPLSLAAFLASLVTLIANSTTFAGQVPVEGTAASGLVAAALDRTKHRVRYDGRYISLDYPGGDVPPEMGVCTDVVIRSYRKIGVDLQVLVHEDMRDNFSEYPALWGLNGTDTNIDHRRVPNLQTFFTRKGESLDVSQNPESYRPGDLVTWMLPGNLPHIGIVIDERSRDTNHPLIVHNIGSGPTAEDILFLYPITGHYRYLGD
jgi:uncharacterized protein YijF (DUF1287 family)